MTTQYEEGTITPVEGDVVVCIHAKVPEAMKRGVVTEVVDWNESWGGLYCGDHFLSRCCFDGTAPMNNQYRVLKR